MTIEEQLSEAKKAFYEALLTHPVLITLILDALDDESDSISALGLKDFDVEPWRPLQEVGQQLGLRINRRRTRSAEGVVVGLAAYSYIKVIVMMDQQSNNTLLIGGDNELFFDGSPALMALDVDATKRQQAAAWFMTCWQSFLQKVEVLGVVLDHQSGTFVAEPLDYQIVR